MNGSCAGGTGAFIDQMSTLIGITPSEMNELAHKSTKIYSIASRCGVFAKSDIQPLLNQGAKKEDISSSIFASVVNQTIAGLSQGRDIERNVIYLGGPLTFFSALRCHFDKTLKINGVCPENSLYYVAYGAASEGCHESYTLDDLIKKTASYSSSDGYISCRPLFSNEGEYKEFTARHNGGDDVHGELLPDKKAYIGIDAGSTTVKMAVINSGEKIIFSKYTQNSGNPVPIVKKMLEETYDKFPGINIVSSASTGYGEEIIKNAFHTDYGIVETIAHYTAAEKYNPNVDFIIDIGGQDIKCFKIKNGAIDNIFLNEACSSGCGSFLQTFANSLGYDVAEFAKKGLFAEKPVDLGSRCTVFMNSSVKQAQKDGASVENISAGLSISVVKNALYKVIRVSSSSSLGENIVVQGGTFLNDAVLRAFEQEIGKNVTRPDTSGLMGAYGAALYAKRQGNEKSGILEKEQLLRFTHDVKSITCGLCTNNCRLTVNTFDGGRKFIGGNQCERPLGSKGKEGGKLNIFDYKRKLLEEYGNINSANGFTIGLPMGLNMYEMLPFWHTFWGKIGFGIKISPNSSKKLYYSGQHSIPSDTVCYPAKLMHGHVLALAEDGVDAVFYPCLTYNFDEGLGDNHFNCPVVAYYPEVISGNMKGVRIIKNYFGVHRPKDFAKKIHKMICREFFDIPLADVKNSVKLAYGEYDKYMNKVCEKGEEYLRYAEDNGLECVVLTGRPYHLDSEINHGIDNYICSQGAVLLSEDSLLKLYSKKQTQILNQWTYHSRMYAAAEYVASQKKGIDLVQLVSFGCGLDAVTSDEVRRILEDKGKIYTQIKIDEITNLGAVKIRLKSLFAVLNTKKC